MISDYPLLRRDASTRTAQVQPGRMRARYFDDTAVAAARPATSLASSLALVYDRRMPATKGPTSRGHGIDVLASVPLTRHTAVRRLKLRGSSTTRLLNLILACLGCILILIKVIGWPTQTARPAGKDVLSCTDFSYFIEHHNVRAIAVNKKTGDVVGYFRIPANRKFRAEMPPGDSYLYDALRNDGAEVAIQ